MKKTISLIIFVFLTFSAYAETVNVKAVGEAEISNGDTASARLVAIARAKWTALEDAAGVKVKSDTILQNAVLVDEAVKTEVGGALTSFRIDGEEQDGSTYRVQIVASVEKNKADDAMGVAAKNTSVSVMLPVVFPDGKILENTALSEAVISSLLAHEMDVTNISDSSKLNINDIDAAMKSNNYDKLRSVAFKNMSNTILIGRVDTSVTVQEGTDIGYGVSLPFNIVTGKLTYRLVTEKNGNKVVLASGYIPVRGQGTTVKDATFRMTENLRDKVAETLVSIVLEKVKGVNSRTVSVRVMGKTDVNKMLELKNILTYTSWVLDVKEQSADTLSLTYPEKTLYLAASINGKKGFKVEKFSDYELVVSY